MAKARPKIFIVEYEAEFIGRKNWSGTMSISGTEDTSEEQIMKQAKSQIRTVLINRFKLKVNPADQGTFLKTSDRITKELEDGTYDPAETEK